ncbi:2-oxo acid dehydrogenase subunit E2 [Streptomyces phaeochromogenes]|uniref:2-oxo acid dehydrogenase subunit E2 n=1 Tax=Streptomyces phaeochromogenes TaxID=1923 RepID=UPI0033C4751F
MGTYAVTSPGHRSVVGCFHSVAGAMVTLGVGRATGRPVGHDGPVEVAEIMRLGLGFDHRAIDGAEAAEVPTDMDVPTGMDVLADIEDGLETIDNKSGTEGRAWRRRGPDGRDAEAGACLWLESTIINVRYFVRGSKFRC